MEYLRIRSPSRLQVYWLDSYLKGFWEHMEWVVNFLFGLLQTTYVDKLLSYYQNNQLWDFFVD